MLPFIAGPLGGRLAPLADADGGVVGEALRVHYSVRGERLDVAKTPFSFTYRPVSADPPGDGDLLVDLGFADLRPGDDIVAYAVPDLPQEQRVGLARVTRAPSGTDPLAFELLDGSVPARCRVRLLRDGVVRADGRWFGVPVAEGAHQREFDRAVPGDLLEAYRRDGDDRSSGVPRSPGAPGRSAVGPRGRSGSRAPRTGGTCGPATSTSSPGACSCAHRPPWRPSSDPA
ncbi:hypothetical protein GCM10010208_04090 [Actinomadura livida]|nr:hypothetical protein GCM10010208_04090 [Actinomadura livida]